MKNKNKSERKSNRQLYMIKKHAQSEQKNKQQRDPIVFMIIEDDYMGMHLPYTMSNDARRCYIRQNGAVWEANFKIWKIPRSSFTNIRSEIPRMLP